MSHRHKRLIRHAVVNPRRGARWARLIGEMLYGPVPTKAKAMEELMEPTVQWQELCKEWANDPPVYRPAGVLMYKGIEFHVSQEQLPWQ